MGFLRRLFKADAGEPRRAAGPGRVAQSDGAPSPATHWSGGIDDHLPDDEVERQRALLRADARRLDDDLIQRQLRYADRAWTPPREGGERRADDGDAPSG
jgi:hypothetical protein